LLKAEIESAKAEIRLMLRRGADTRPRHSVPVPAVILNFFALSWLPPGWVNVRWLTGFDLV